jgi:transcriptional regulator with XRE-family HTH domain
MSQLDLGLAAEVSTRHLSFIETGRARPSPELVVHLAEHLHVPLRERNSLLLAAGYAPRYHETPLAADDMAPVRAALDRILRGHEPFPAIVVDGRWDLVTANGPATELMSSLVAGHLLEPPVNGLRLSLHPEGLAGHIENLGEYSAHLLARLDRQAAAAGDDRLYELGRELRTYPGVGDATGPSDTASLLFVPLIVRTPSGVLRFFSTIATFGTALDITIADLAIESFFPADDATAKALAK